MVMHKLHNWLKSNILDVEIKSAFESNARLQFIEHVNADLPIVKELGGISIQASLNLRAGKIIRDYVKE